MARRLLPILLLGVLGVAIPSVAAARDAGMGSRAQSEGPATEAGASDGCILRAELDGIVVQATAGYLRDAVERAEREGCQAVLVTIDTPGGVLDATRDIVRAFLSDRVAVITYVSPSGARAGSAGVFITMAGHVAAMAPGSNIGAAHPVVGMGQDPEEQGEHMADKIVNDTAALARSIAERRGRNAAWAERAVRESVSATASEAVEGNVVDRVAGSERALLQALDGATVTLGEATVRLSTADAEVRSHEMSLRQRVLTVLGNPTLAYILLMVGIFGLMIEAYSPGLIVPGAVGAAALLLAAIGLNAVPVNIGAIVLLAVAVGLFVAELHVASYGLLAAGGLAALLLGSALLIDEADPDFFADASVRLSWGAVIPLAVVVALASLALAWTAGRSQKRRSPTGREGLVGATGRAATEVGPGGGRVQVAGESWRATAEAAISAGSEVRVTEVEGLTVKVERVEPARRAHADRVGRRP